MVFDFQGINPHRRSGLRHRLGVAVVTCFPRWEVEMIQPPHFQRTYQNPFQKSNDKMPPKNIIRSVEPKWQLFRLEKDLMSKNYNPHTTKKNRFQRSSSLFILLTHGAANCCWTLFFFHQKPYWLRLSGRHYSDSDAGSYFSIWPAKAKQISVKDNSSKKNTSICGRTQSHDLPTLLWIYIS